MKMRKNPLASSLMIVALFLVGTALNAAPATAASPGSPACTPQTNPFSVTDASWGTPGSPISVYPGDQNVPLTITMLFSGPCSSPQADFILSFADASNPTPFTGPNGITQPKDVGLNITPNSFVTETFYLNVNQHATTGVTYYVSMIIQYANNTVGDVVTEVTRVPIALYGPVQLNFAANSINLVAGATNNVTISILNSGSAASGPVSTTVTLPSGVTLLNRLATTTSIDPGSSVSLPLEIFVSSSLNGTASVLTFTAEYLDAYSISQTVTQTVGFVVSTTVGVESNVLLVFQTAEKPLTPDAINQVTITVSNMGTTLARQINTVVSATGGPTVLAQPSEIATLSPGANSTETVGVFVPATAAGSAFSFTLASTYLDIKDATDSSSSALGLSVASTAPPEIEVSQTGSGNALVPGQLDTVSAAIENVGTGAATRITLSASVSAQAGSVEAVSPSLIASLAPGGSFPINITLFVAPSAENSPITLTFAVAYVDEYGQAGSATPTLGLHAESTAQIFADVALSITSLKNSVVAGTDSTVSFVMKNVGKAAIYSPVYAFTPSQPLIVVGNSTFSALGTVINPGQSQTFYATLTSSPSATSGIYSGNLSVDFSNEYGVSDRQSYSVDVLLSGPVELVVQNELFSQNATDVTVTGNILNEGLASAYYASVSGSLNESKSAGSPDYVGEIDTNSPVPFSVVIPYRAQGTGVLSNVTLAILYKNSLGQVSNSSSSAVTELKSSQVISASQPSSTPSTQAGPSLLELVVILTASFVAVGTAAVAVIRKRGRTRSGRGGKTAEGGSAQIA